MDVDKKENNVKSSKLSSGWYVALVGFVLGFLESIMDLVMADHYAGVEFFGQTTTREQIIFATIIGLFFILCASGCLLYMKLKKESKVFYGLVLGFSLVALISSGIITMLVMVIGSIMGLVQSD